MKSTTSSAEKKPAATNHSFFAAYYERVSGGTAEREMREEIVGMANGRVLEVGAGTGLNFRFYEPGRVEHVDATEPDTAMLGYARKRLETARVPITLIQAGVEDLPFPDETFDSVVATLVFCSVTDPARGFSEIKRVLKPDGVLLLVEHVRAQNAFAAWLQDALVPITTRFAGNCHWNRDTARTVAEAGFQITRRRDIRGGLSPVITLQAVRS